VCLCVCVGLCVHSRMQVCLRGRLRMKREKRTDSDGKIKDLKNVERSG
jgi:hypothetical protein